MKTVGIKSIQPDGTEDVYNMEVKGTHNFAVNGGLIIHNCMDAVRYYVKTRKLVKKDWNDATTTYISRWH